MQSFAHEISGMSVHALDGDLGTIKDLLFDSQSWKVRYLEVSTGWLLGRDVIIPVDKVTAVEIEQGRVSFELTKQEIENSPEAEPARPVERDYESRLINYYGLAPYWATPPEVGVPPQALPVDRRVSREPPASDLIFAGDLDGYDLDARGEIIGTVRDILVDLDAWRVTSFMADLGGILVRDVANIRIGPVTAIDSANRIVHLSVSKERIERVERMSVEDLPYVFPYVPPMA